MDTLEEIARDEATGLTAYLVPEPHQEQPFAADEAVKIVVLHRRYRNPARGDIDTLDEARAFEADAERGSGWAVFPLYLYDHGATIYSVSDGGNPFIGWAPHAEWDSSRVGFIALRRAAWGTGRNHRRTLRKWAKSIAADYTAWANGWGVAWEICEDDGTVVDSVGGYLDRDAAVADAKASLAAAARDRAATPPSRTPPSATPPDSDDFC